MMSIEKSLRIFFNRFFLHQHPETALRYLPIVSVMAKKGLKDSKLLEVGSGSLGITPYLKRPIDGIDVNFSGPQTELVNTTLPPAQKVVGPPAEIVGVAGNAVTVTVVPADVADVQPPVVTATVYVPEVETVID